MGIFVVAENSQNKMTVTVLSDAQGRYHINNLPAATYSVQTSAVGYRSDPRSGVTTYRLTNLKRGEPPADLFKVPSDYRVGERRGG